MPISILVHVKLGIQKMCQNTICQLKLLHLMNLSLLMVLPAVFGPQNWPHLIDSPGYLRLYDQHIINHPHQKQRL